MKRVFFYFFMLLLCSSSCTKSEGPLLSIPDTQEDTTSLVIWQIPLELDSAEYLSIDVQLLDNGVLASRRAVAYSQMEALFMVDKNTGSRLWQWDDYMNPSSSQRIADYDIIENVIVLNSNRDSYGVSKDDGSTVWSAVNNEGDPRISTFENLVFHPYSYGSAPRSHKASIAVCDAKLGNWEEKVTFLKEGDYEVTCKVPAAYRNENGDIILIFNVSRLKIPATSEVELYAFNMTQDTFIWEKKNFNAAGAANIKPPLIDGDYVYHVGFREIFCINKYTGETIWQWGFPDSPYGFSDDFLIHEEKFIIPRSNGNLYAIHKGLGTVIWSIENHEAGFSSNDLRVYNEMLYYGSGRLYVIDINAGQVVHAIRSPNRSSRFPHAQFLNGVAVDLERKHMYTTDGYFLMCMRLLE